MNKLHFYITCVALMSCLVLFGQSDGFPQRTPEEEAKKQTEMLVRELHITDTTQRNSIYHLNLKYARMRAVSNTRAENLERIQQFTEELQGVLTKEQFNQFMNCQVDSSPRHPQQPLYRGPQHPDGGHHPNCPPPPPYEERGTPPPM